MSKGLNTNLVPFWVAQGIERAFHEWLDMPGNYALRAPLAALAALPSRYR
jgi:hypothetical protein